MSHAVAPDQNVTVEPAAALAPASSGHLYGFDYLRAALSLLVIAWHCDVFDKRHFFRVVSEGDASFNEVRFSDLINYHVFQLPVPTFILIAIFLFFYRGRPSATSIALRLERLFYLYIIWCGLWWVVTGFIDLRVAPSADPDTEIPMFLSLPPLEIFVTFVNGFGSASYFFFSLFVATCLAIMALYLPRAVVWILAIVTLASLWGIPLYVKSPDSPASLDRLVAYWNPINFLCYAFIGQILADWWRTGPLRRPSAKAVLAGCVALSFVTACVEWQMLTNVAPIALLRNHYEMPTYTRISVAIGSIGLVVAALLVTRPAPTWIRWLSDHSLAIYIIHPFVIYAYRAIVGRADIYAEAYDLFAATLVISIALAWMFRRAIKLGLA